MDNASATHHRLLADILSDAAQTGHDDTLTACTAGRHLVMAQSDTAAGLCSRSGVHGAPPPETPDLAGARALETARWLAHPEQGPAEAVSFGMAAANIVLAPPKAARPFKAQELILSRGRGKRVAVVGHFPFVERMGDEFERMWVLELDPGPGDLPADRAEEVLPLADVAALTATTLLNGTCASLLSLIRPEAYVIVLGPSCPFSEALFDWGVDAVAGAAVIDPASAAEGITAGRPFKGLCGVRPLLWRRERRRDR